MDQDRSQKTEEQILALADAMKTGTMQHARGMLGAESNHGVTRTRTGT